MRCVGLGCPRFNIPFSDSTLISFVFNVFIYPWLSWSSVLHPGSLYLQGLGFTLWWFPLLQRLFSAWASVLATHELRSGDIWAVEHRLSSFGSYT